MNKKTITLIALITLTGYAYAPTTPDANTDNMIQPLIEVTQGSTMGFSGELIFLIATIVLSLTITHNTHKLKALVFPMSIGLYNMGFQINPIIIIILAGYFVHTILADTKLFQDYITLKSVIKGTRKTAEIASAGMQKIKGMKAKRAWNKFATKTRELRAKDWA